MVFGDSKVRVLGFDCGITSPGLGVITRLATGYRLDAHRVVRTKASEPLEARCHRIWQALSSAIAQWRPALVAVEEQAGAQVGAYKRGDFNADNSKTIMTVGLALGAAFAYGIDVTLIKPQRAKIAVCGPKMSRADKREVQAAVERITGVRVPQDAADAVANAIAAAQMIPFRKAG